MTLKNAQWVLASGSPRRRELLKLLGSRFEAIPSQVNEVAKAGESPQELVRRLAREKAEANSQDSPRSDHHQRRHGRGVRERNHGEARVTRRGSLNAY